MQCYLCSRLQSFFETVGDVCNTYWVCFRSNLGGQPTELLGDDRQPLRILLFAVFLACNIIFMSYRASLTSELVTREGALNSVKSDLF